MKTISYYISMVVILAATIFTGCTDDDEKSLSPRAGELSIYDFAPNTGKGGTQLLINGEQFPLDATSISVSINEVQLSILRSNEEQLLVEVPNLILCVRIGNTAGAVSQPMTMEMFI